MIVKGRGIRKPEIQTFSIDENHIQLRIDCEKNPEFWAEIILSKDDILQLLNKVNNSEV